MVRFDHQEKNHPFKVPQALLVKINVVSPEIYGVELMGKFEAHLESQWEPERCRQRVCGNLNLKKEIIFPGWLREVKTLALESVGSQAFCEHRAHLYSVTFT